MNYQQIMRQAQLMQKKMLEMQEELAQKKFEAKSGGGMVSATVSGSGQLLSLKIEKEVVDPNDVEMLEDLIVAAINEALKQVASASGGGDMAAMVQKMGIKLPGF